MTTLSKETHDRLGLDHGALSGKGDDDHTQYLLVDGTRAMTGGLDPATDLAHSLGSPTKRWIGIHGNIGKFYDSVLADTIGEVTTDNGVIIDGLEIKDGSPPNYNSRKWIPVIFADDGIIKYLDWYGGKMTDAATKVAGLNFAVPNDFVSSGTLKAVIISKATGNLVYTLSVMYGADGETMNAHTASSGEQTVSVTLLNVDVLSYSLSLADLAIGDIMSITFEREGGNANDTIDDDVLLIGCVFDYIGNKY